MNEFLPTVKTPQVRDARLKEKNAHRINTYVDIELTTRTTAGGSSTGGGKKAKPSGASLSDFGNPYSFDTLTGTFTTRYTGFFAFYSYTLGASEVDDSQGVAKGPGGKTKTINAHASWQYDKNPLGKYRIGGYACLDPLELFTAGPAAEAIQPGTMGRTAVWERWDKEEKEKN